MNQFKDEWQKWAALCIHPGAGAQTRASLELAFYSGAMTWAGLIRRIMTENDSVESLRLVIALHSEIGNYADQPRAEARKDQLQ
jgi:hypothetical protein